MMKSGESVSLIDLDFKKALLCLVNILEPGGYNPGGTRGAVFNIEIWFTWSGSSFKVSEVFVA